MGKEYLDIPFEIKEIDDKDGTFSGMASTFGGEPDSYGDVIAKGAFSESLAAGGRNGFGVAMLWQHKTDQPLGTWTELIENSKGLKVTGKLTKGVKQADEALLLLKDGALKGMSIGYDVPKDGYVFDDKTGVRYLKKINLWEISIVSFPANTRAQITGVKAIEDAKTERELETALRDAGLSQKQALIMVSRCKPYLREIRERKSLKDVLSVLHSVNTQMEVRNIFK